MKGYPSREQVEHIKAMYPVGTRIKLNYMSDPYAPVPEGIEGKVTFVDDMGQLGMVWSNGRTLSLIPYEDSFSVISRPEEQESTTMTMGGMS